MVPRAHPNPQPKHHRNWFSCFWRAHYCDRQTDHATPSLAPRKSFDILALYKSDYYYYYYYYYVTIGCIYVRTTEIITVLQTFFWDHPGEPVPEENLWTLWCKGRLTEADTPTIRLGATPYGLTSAHLHHPPIFFTGRMPFLPPNQQHQSTEGN